MEQGGRHQEVTAAPSLSWLTCGLKKLPPASPTPPEPRQCRLSPSPRPHAHCPPPGPELPNQVRTHSNSKATASVCGAASSALRAAAPSPARATMLRHGWDPTGDQRSSLLARPRATASHPGAPPAAQRTARPQRAAGRFRPPLRSPGSAPSRPPGEQRALGDLHSSPSLTRGN